MLLFSLSITFFTFYRVRLTLSSRESLKMALSKTVECAEKCAGTVEVSLDTEGKVGVCVYIFTLKFVCSMLGQY